MRWIWVVIPLVLIGIIGMEESFGYGGGGGGGKEPDPRVCGDRLCSEISGGRDAWESSNGFFGQSLKVTDEITDVESVCLVAILDTVVIGKVPSPRMQIFCDIEPETIRCNEGLQLIFKASDNSPACVKPETALKLLERGWTEKVSYGIWTNIYESQIGNFVDSYFSPKYQLSDDSFSVQRYNSADGYPPLVILRATLFSIDSYTNEIIDHYLSFTIKNNTISSIREYYDYGKSRLISLDTAKLQEIELAENRRGSLDHIITNLEDYYDQKVTVEGKLFKWRNWPGMGVPITHEYCYSLKSYDQYRTLDLGWWILQDQVGNSLALIKDNLNSQKWSPEDEFLGKQVSINGTLIPTTTTVGCSTFKSAYLLFENIELI